MVAQGTRADSCGRSFGCKEGGLRISAEGSPRKGRALTPSRRLNLPPDPRGSRYAIEILVTAQQRKFVLPAEGGDPEAVGRDRPAGLFELTHHFGVMRG